MRNVLRVVLVLGYAAIGFAPVLDGRAPFSLAYEEVQRFLHKKEIVISGTGRLSTEYVRSFLPQRESVLWWMRNQSEVENGLKQIPLVKDVSVSNCEKKYWGCFEVKVKERSPTYVALVNSRAWIVADDGAFIAPIPQVKNEGELFEYLRNETTPLIFVAGIASAQVSPDIVKARLLYLHDALQVIESEVGHKVERVEIRDSGELSVGFRGVGYRATFGYQGQDLSRLGKEARRLGLLLTKFEGREQILQSVDLAYDKLAVVKLVTP